MRIDLHAHSTASDGTDTPLELVGAARAAGLDVLAITDHDTTAGWASALASLPAGLTLVRGAEFSCRYYDPAGTSISLHLLAYLFDDEDQRLRTEQSRLQDERLGRAQSIVHRLSAAGMPVTWEQVTRIAGSGTVGRPHIAQALVESGLVSDLDAAFAGPLSSASPYYVAKADTDVFEMIELINGARGVAVFAHPLARSRGAVVDDEVIAAMAGAGLAGIEVEHPDHTSLDRSHLAGLARDLGLIITGSSDYHGDNKRTSLGACTTAPESFEAIVSMATAIGPVGMRG